jgi:hypothetical protein
MSASKIQSKNAPHASQAPQKAKYTILFHGNCIDGWMSCYIAHSSIKNYGSVRQYPIAPGQPNTWPAVNVMRNNHVLLVDVSVPQETRDMWLACGVLSVKCIDHHASAVEHWPADSCPINTESCAAIQTWQFFYPQMPIPEWLHCVDRIDRWDHPTEEDRCLREVLHVIAHKPVQRKFDEAYADTDAFMQTIHTEAGKAATIERGRVILQKKDEDLFKVLGKGNVMVVAEQHVAVWKLPASWLGITLYIIDNTDVVFDTTEAAHQVFTHYPQVNVFINYRKKTFLEKGDMAVEKTVYVYSARSCEFDLTKDGSVFKGHPTSAGVSLVCGEAPLIPFLFETTVSA